MPRNSIKEGMIGPEGLVIEKFVERMEFMLIHGMKTNHRPSLKMTLVKSFGILLYRQTIL